MPVSEVSPVWSNLVVHTSPGSGCRNSLSAHGATRVTSGSGR